MYSCTQYRVRELLTPDFCSENKSVRNNDSVMKICGIIVFSAGKFACRPSGACVWGVSENLLKGGDQGLLLVVCQPLTSVPDPVPHPDLFGSVCFWASRIRIRIR